MKKILPAIVLASLLVSLAVPALVSAQEGIPSGCTLRQDINISDLSYFRGDVITEDTPDWGIICMLNTLYNVTTWFFYVLLILSVILIIWGAFGILFAAGDPERMAKGRTTVVYALVGIAIALFAKVIPSIIKFMMGL